MLGRALKLQYLMQKLVTIKPLLIQALILQFDCADSDNLHTIRRFYQTGVYTIRV